MKTASQLLDKIAISSSLDFGDIFSRAIELFQKVWVQGLLLQVIRIVIQYGVMMILYIPMMGSVFLFPTLEQGDGSSIGVIIWSILFMILYLAVILLVAIAAIGVELGFYRLVRNKERGIKESGVNFGMFFKKPHLKKLILFSLVQTGLAIGAALLFILPLFYIIVPLQYANIIFANHPEYTIKEVYTVAFRLGNKKWLLTFGLVVVAGIVAAIIGILACFIGIYATLSFVYLPAYLIYKDVIGFTEDDDAIATIGSKLPLHS